MTGTLTLLSLFVAIWRIRHRLFRPAEWALLVLFAAHFLVTQAQVAIEGGASFGFLKGFLYVDWRYVSPAFFLSWGWLAWAISMNWERAWKIRRVRFSVKQVIVIALAVMSLYGLRKSVRANFPWVKRCWIVSGCDQAARRIRQDWKGPARNATNEFWLSEYNSPLRPNVHGPSGRLAYLVKGCAVDSWPVENGPDKIPDYWMATAPDEVPPPGLKFVLIDKYQCGKRLYLLYRREGEP